MLDSSRDVSPRESAPVAGLRADGVTVRYGGVVANEDVSLVIAQGQIAGLIGPNGAGKTTFIDALTGYASCSGHVHVGEACLDDLPPHRRQHAGLSRTWQAGELFTSLTVADNVRVSQDWGGPSRLGGRRRKGIKSGEDRTLASLEMVGLADHAERHISELSLGQQRLLGVARALASSPRVVLLDEPGAGLDTEGRHMLGQTLRQVAASGVAMLLVDHDVNLVFDVSHLVYVLDFGRIIAAGTPDEIRSSELVVKAYLGAPGSLEEAE
jgi:branched-chain amino acid transport system ATP-binding protein